METSEDTSEAQLLLIAESSAELGGVVEGFCKNCDFQMHLVESYELAKRELLQTTPQLILSKYSLPEFPEGGLKFCKDLQGHATLSTIPLIFLSEEASEDKASVVREIGAKGLLALPSSPEELKDELSSLLPSIFSNAEVVEERLKKVKQLLAQVLYNISTSGVLEKVSEEDIPTVVSEATNLVCELQTEDK